MTVGTYLVATLLVGLLALLILSFFAIRRAAAAWMLYRGPQVILCPETGRPAGVTVDMKHAEKTAIFSAEPDLRLASCSRWPERAGCGQECLSQIESTPGECAVRFQLEHWYAGKRCIYCRKPFEVIEWHDHKPTLVNGDGELLAWTDIAPEKLPEVLSTHFPVCWSCDAIERFRREHPELITDITGRDRRTGVSR